MNEGWICPKCGTCYSPFITLCHRCQWTTPADVETAAKLAALVESAEKLRHVVEGADAPEAP